MLSIFCLFCVGKLKVCVRRMREINKIHIQQPSKFLKIAEIINELDCFLCIWLSKMSSVPCLKRAARNFSGVRCTENRRDFLAPLGLVAPVGPLHYG